MSIELSATACIEAADALGLPHPGLVEKDHHIVRALVALATVEQDGARLVFGGGTSLCRAYRLIQRMSEDVDLRIAGGTAMTEGQRRRWRERVSTVLLQAGFDFDPADARHLEVHDGGRSFVYHLPYVPLTGKVASLRAGIRVEVSSSPLQCAPVVQPLSSFLTQAYGREADIAGLPCVALVETLAEKFVALTRRIAHERHLSMQRDPTLLRHVYDLHRLAGQCDAETVAPLLRTAMRADREARGRQFAAYAADPVAVSRAAIQALAQDPWYGQAFRIFQRDMVYGEHVSLHACIPVLAALAAWLTHD